MALDEISRIEATEQEERAYGAARGNLVALRSYVNTCRLCKYKAAAIDEISRLESSEQEERAYRAAHDNLAGLRAYVSNCRICAFKSAALDEIARLDATEKEERAYNAARGNLPDLRSYVSNCKVCVYKSAALSEINVLSSCGGNADYQIIRPIELLYQAVNRKDIEQYAQQWADDARFQDPFVTGSRSQNKEEKMSSKSRSFAKLELISVTMDKPPEIINKTFDRAEVRVTYTSMLKYIGQGCMKRTGIQERYTVVCNATGRWQIWMNIDEINVSGRPSSC